jgi:signal transduction histidine kinase
LVYGVGARVAAAKSDLPDSPQRASAEIGAALLLLDASIQTSDRIASVRSALHEAGERLAQQPGAVDPSVLDRSFSALADLSAATRQAIAARQVAADQKHRLTLAVVLSVCGIVVLCAAVLGWRQYRGVMQPLKRLGDAARGITAGNLAQRLPATGDQEFAALAQDFNRMAAELQTLYQNLEQQVQIKSKQLVRSERLASVGFLAAGVAHEINNPLSIITGYGERALQNLDRSGGPDHARKAIGVMCEEAFRCKRITDQLLALARPGNEARGLVSLPRAVDDVVSCLAGLPEYAERKIIVHSESPETLTVNGIDGQIRQVILNLIVNAMQATAADGTGQIRVSIVRRPAQVELAVEDNGRGMSAETLEHVFEPFFTLQRGADKPGTGLGLSVTHAIVTDHGGTIHAESDGPGCGSRFTVRLPFAREGASLVRG